MSEEENKAIVRRLVEEFQSGHKFEVGQELTADDFIDRTPGPGESGNKEDGLEFFKYIWEAFPDFSVEIKEQIAEGDRVATLKTFSGTHKVSSSASHRPATTWPSMCSTCSASATARWSSTGTWWTWPARWQQLGAMPPTDG